MADTALMLSFQRLDVYQRAIEFLALAYDVVGDLPMECAASLDVMRLRKLISDVRYERGIHLLQGVVAMLTKML
jgi:hypothetical protein